MIGLFSTLCHFSYSGTHLCNSSSDHIGFLLLLHTLFGNLLRNTSYIQRTFANLNRSDTYRSNQLADFANKKIKGCRQCS